MARLPAGTSLGVVITGSTRGVGRALAEEFARGTDGVVVSSRTPEAVERTVATLRRRYPDARIHGLAADVACAEDVARLAAFAAERLGTVHALVCNAGAVGTRARLEDVPAGALRTVVETNLLGPLHCAQAAFGLAARQGEALHVFMTDGSGTTGNATAEYAAYGATKRALPQLVASLSKEAAGGSVRFHMLSPGMVLTGLLMGGNADARTRGIFNFLAEEPETVAEDLVPRIREVVVRDQLRSYTRFLTIPKAIFQLSTGFLLGFRKNKFFDQITGERVDRSGTYDENGVRVKEE